MPVRREALSRSEETPGVWPIFLKKTKGKKEQNMNQAGPHSHSVPPRKPRSGRNTRDEKGAVQKEGREGAA